ncbi:MAG: hypothetical protein IKD90_04715 [Clostridiales bacterium]|nr:hypothetical protein [Clostridiales bacterium]
MFGKENHITLDDYKLFLEILWNTNRTETEAVQKAVEYFLWALFGLSSDVSVVDVHNDNIITSKHDPSRFYLLRGIEAKKESLTKKRMTEKTREDIKSRYETAQNEFAKRKNMYMGGDDNDSFYSGPPDLMVVKNYNYENIEHGNGTICFLVETKEFEEDLKKIQEKDSKFSQIFSHMTQANNVVLTNGKMWILYTQKSNDHPNYDEWKQEVLQNSKVFELWNDKNEKNTEKFEELCETLKNLAANTNKVTC